MMRSPNVSALLRFTIPLLVLGAVAAFGGCGGTSVTCSGAACGGSGGGGGSGNGGCLSNAICANMGPNVVCRGQEKCVSLTNELCPVVYTTKKNPSDAIYDIQALVLGAILPTAGADANYGQVIEDSIKLAIDDFAKVNGLPPAGPGMTNRPIVVVGCNDGPNEDQAVAAAKHLVDDLEVQAIIGYSFSGSTLAVATQVTIPKGVLLISPSATSDALTTLADNDLVWSVAPPDSSQSAAFAAYYPEVEARARALFPAIPVNGMKVAVVHNGDTYGVGIADKLQAKLSFNGKSAVEQIGAGYKSFSYGMPESPDLSVVPAVVSFEPHVIFLAGFNEGVVPILSSIEAQWGSPADGHKPLWVLSDGGEVPQLWLDAVTSDDLRMRVTGTVPGASASYAPYATFLATFDASFYSKGGAVSADVFGAAGAYDILYLLAYSAAMIPSGEPLLGANFAKWGLRRMGPDPSSPKATVGEANITSTFALLATGQPIDIEGASGPLTFDQSGAPTADIQIWCLPPGGAPAVAGPAIPSGRYYSAATGAMAGSIGAACALP